MAIETVDQCQNTPVSYSRDCWPWPISSSDPSELGIVLHRRTLDFVLDMASLPEGKSTYTDLALSILDQLMSDIFQVKRWEIFRVPEIGDMNGAMHTLRQTLITVIATGYDTELFKVLFRERDIMAAAAILHDIGELVVGDTPVGSMIKGNRLYKIWEVKAAFNRIESLGLPVESVAALKEIYWRVTTDLEEIELVEVELIEAGESSFSAKEVRWELLRKLFGLYERYGYLITALELWPGISSFSCQDRERIQAGWGREELRDALRRGDVSEHMRIMALIVDVMSRQWPRILEVQEVLPSARILFGSDMAVRIIPDIDELTGLNIQPLGS